MRKLLVPLTALVITAGLCIWSAEAADKSRVNQEILGRLQFPTPKNKAAKKYLGLSGIDKFTISQVRARTVILEIFSMYCPICQAEAPTVNKLFRLVQKNVRLRGKVKVIGVGTGNSPFEVEVFRKKYSIPFPLFADEGFLMKKVMRDEIRTPTFLVLKIEPGKEPIVQDVHIGRLSSPRKFLETLPELSKGK